MPSAFALDPRLAADTTPVHDLALSRVLLMNDATYPWLIVVPRLPGLVDLIDLTDLDRRWAMDEVAKVAAALKAVTRCDKLNVASLGNQVAQFHVHVIARFSGDPAWPGPVWGKVPPQDYAPAAREGFIAELRAALGADEAP